MTSGAGFGKHGSRAVAIQPVVRLNNDINVTPLVDVVLVLLIIFMVVTPLLEKDITVQVASSQHVEQPREMPRDQIVVRVSSAGDFEINAESVSSGRYVERLKQLLAGKAEVDRVVFFTADDAANYAKFVTALDGAKLAGAKVLGLTPEETSEKTAPAAGQ